MSKKQTVGHQEKLPQTTLGERVFNHKYSKYFYIALLLIIPCAMFFNVAFLGYVPNASDNLQWQGSAHQLLEYGKTHSDQALWTDNMFAGMPGYMISFPQKYPFLDNIFSVINKLINWRIFMLFFAGLGVFLLMQLLGFEALIAFISAIGFALTSHFVGLIEIGHNTKFLATVYMPWIMWALHYLYLKRSVLGLGLLSVFMIIQLKQGHAQITYYIYLMIGVYWLIQLIQTRKSKDFGKFGVFTLLLLLAFIITVLAVAQPYLSNYEYSKYTIRGGSQGLTKEYATGWSFGKAEVLTFFFPDFFGGVSPLYWGAMPFTQTSMYMGIILFLLAILAAIYVRTRWVTFLAIVSVCSILVSFGSNLNFLSDFLLKYLPGFNKFRVPVMTLVLLEFATVVLAGYGLKLILDKAAHEDRKFFKIIKNLFFGSIIVAGIFLIGRSIFSSMNMIRPDELAKYGADQVAQIKQFRLDKLASSGLQSSLFAIMAFGLTLLLGTKKISKYSFLFLIAVLVIADLSLVDMKFLKSDNLIEEKYQINNFQATETDNFLLADSSTYRIYPLGGEFQQARWSYYHESIGGYHGAKLKRYQEVIENCMNKPIRDNVPINWNIVNLLNVKYYIAGGQIPLPNMQLVYADTTNMQFVYQNLEFMPRAWFVKNTQTLQKPQQIWDRLNSPTFIPSQTAITEELVSGCSAPDTSFAKLQDKNIHYAKWQVMTNKQAFLTVSEIYYPAGWKAFIDGKETKIYPTNYILRGIVVPAGSHTLEFKFAPENYSLSLKLSLLGILLSLAALLIGILHLFLKKKENIA